MTGDEHEPEQVVADVLVERGLEIRTDRRLDDGVGCNLLVRALQHLLPPELVEGPVLRRGHEPGARILRDAGLGPALERGDQRLLGQILGEADFADHADEATEKPRGLDPPHRLDGAAGGCLAHRAALRSFSAMRAFTSLLTRATGSGLSG